MLLSNQKLKQVQVSLSVKTDKLKRGFAEWASFRLNNTTNVQRSLLQKDAPTSDGVDPVFVRATANTADSRDERLVYLYFCFHLYFLSVDLMYVKNKNFGLSFKRR